MNPITIAEEGIQAIETGGASVYLKLAWKFAPYIVIGILFAALMITRATLHDARQDAKLLAAQSAEALAKEQAKWAADGKNAAETYANALSNRQPIIVHATDTVREYAKTPAGAAVCAAPGIDELHREPNSHPGLANTSFQHIPRTQLFTYLTDIS